MSAPCPNRLGAEFGEDFGPCGDEGLLCGACSERRFREWMREAGIHEGMDPETARLLAGPPATNEEMEEWRRLK